MNCATIFIYLHCLYVTTNICQIAALPIKYDLLVPCIKIAFCGLKE